MRRFTTSLECRKCDCGKDANCTFDTTFWRRKTCVCKEGSSIVYGKCKDPCDPNPCKNDGICNVLNRKINCTCKAPFTGDTCEKDPCVPNPCKNKGTCKVVNGKIICSCKPPFTGNFCDKNLCNLNPCKNKGTCKVLNGKINCTCIDPFTGDTCEINQCDPNPCKNEGICNVLNGKINCSCVAPYTGDTCEINQCEPNPCYNEGTCNVVKGEVHCTCKEPYVGERCKIECPCENGKCHFVGEEWQCICNSEYGLYDKGLCKACDCGKRANCTFDNYSTTKKCVCPKGMVEYEEKCLDPETHDPCKSNPCENNGTCKKNGVEASCSCSGRYYGKWCSQDRCSPNPCSNGGMCDFKEKEFICSCVDPFVGKKCEKNACVPNPCKNNGTCSAVKGSITCLCQAPYFGNRCEKDPCTKNPCKNGGSCRIDGNSYKCVCKVPYVGPLCDNYCRCINGSCIEKNGKYECQCKPGFGRYLTGNCKACDCGIGINCTYSDGWKKEKQCLCPDGYLDIKGKCEVIPSPSTPSTTPSTVSSSKTDITAPIPKSTNNAEYSTSFPSTITSRITTDTRTHTTQFTNNEAIYKPCKKNKCKNKGTCVIKDGEEKCICQYPFGGDLCTDSYWCTEGPGKELCKSAKCVFDFKMLVGLCKCPKEKYFNYDKRECMEIDWCPLTQEKCNSKNEICIMNECKCKDHYRRNDKNECVPNFCMSKKVDCGENAICEEVEKNPGAVRCSCKNNYAFNGKTCFKVKKCDVPSIYGCQQICNKTTESCECNDGFTLQNDKRTCKLVRSNNKCRKNCGVGTCMKSNAGFICVCPATHISTNSGCIDLCTAKKVPQGLCPDDECMPDKNFGFKCKCVGKLTYNSDLITCRRKLMCIEGNGTQTCSSKFAKCVEDFDSKYGFHCECPENKEEDEQEICREKCDLKKYQNKCKEQLATCYMEGSEAKCKCPPLVTFNKENICTQLAKASYTGSLTFSRQKYTREIMFAPPAPPIVAKCEKIREDLMKSMQLIYGSSYTFADILDCRDSDEGLKCKVEIKFSSDPKNQIKVISDPSTCIAKNENECLIPPGLILQKKDTQQATFVETDPCMKEIKKSNCGLNETECSKVPGAGLHYICECTSGFESSGVYHPIEDKRTVIHKCEDIDECLNLKACPNNTKCMNTYGSYECSCLEGYMPSYSSVDPKFSGCIEICPPSFCDNGKCDVDGHNRICRCNEGYTGPPCKRKIERTEKPREVNYALITTSVIVIPLVLLVAYIVHKYRLYQRFVSRSSYPGDDKPSISMEPLHRK